MTETMGQRLARLRHHHGLSQGQLAAASNLPQATISRIETVQVQGENMLLGTAMRLAWALGISIDVLAGMPDQER